jgi:uncharacterized protein (TIGR01619 family)
MNENVEEHWESYATAMGDHYASVVVNIGIGDVMESEVPETLLKVRLTFNEADDEGLPTDEEYNIADQLEDELLDFVEENEDHYVGRLMVSGQRIVFIYVTDDSKYSRILQELSQKYGYELQPVVTNDVGHESYWDFLYPTTTDWQMISDLRVLGALAESDDDPSQARPVEHWVYFEEKTDADSFVVWALENDFKLADEITENEDEEYLVKLTHTGTMELNDICARTIPLADKADELGGRYDGWETSIVKAGGEQ